MQAVVLVDLLEQQTTEVELQTLLELQILVAERVANTETSHLHLLVVLEL
jgi:hypothetical protein